MAGASFTTLLPFRRTAGLAVLSLATLACGWPSDALGSTAQAPRKTGIQKVHFDPSSHLVDEPTARKVVAVMRAWTPPLPKPSKQHRDDLNLVGGMQDMLERAFTTVAYRELAEQNSTATIDGTPALTAAIAGQGLSSRDFAKALIALQMAKLEMETREMVVATGAKVNYELRGTLKANADLVRRLKTEGGFPSGWF